MIIQIDSREKARAIKKIVEEFNRQGVRHPVSKLMVGDYMNYDNPRLIIDRKQNLTELCSNVCQDHDRFRRELIKAQENDIKMVFLVEHGKGIRSEERRVGKRQLPARGCYLVGESQTLETGQRRFWQVAGS